MKKQRLKKQLTVSCLSVALLTASLQFPGETVQARSLEELTQEKNKLDAQFGEISTEITERDAEMQALQSERESLESEVLSIQASIDALVEKIDAQTATLLELEENIHVLQEQIEALKIQIAQREEKLQNQARAVQTQGNTTSMVHIVISAENLSDLVGRLGLISNLVGANKEIVRAQVDDQQELEETEAQVREEKRLAEAIKVELEENQAALVAEKQNLDEAIVQVAETYEMTAAEKEAFIEEQKNIAQQASTLNEEIKAEKARIAEEARIAEAARVAEAARIAREKAAAEAASRKQAEQNRLAAIQQAKDAAAKQAANSSTEKPKPVVAAPVVSKPAPKPSTQQTSSGFIRPSNGYKTSSYGYRIHPIFFTRKLHAGVDIAGGGPIVAAKAGKVVHAGYNSGLGYYVKIDHGGGQQTVYGHMTPALQVSMGQTVSQGQMIGTMGTTGNSTGVHLHFELHINGRTVDPAPYIGI